MKPKGIQNITPEDKEAVIQAFEQWSVRRHSPDRKWVELLFNKYHRYVYKSPSDISCGACVQFIYDYWKKQVAAWRAQQ